MKRTKLNKNSKRPIAKLKKEADRRFSIFIRKRGGGICFTCGLRREWKLLQCGHFVSRSHSITRYDEINCQSQCFACNVWKRGNIAEFAVRLDEKYGEGTAKSLVLKSRQTHQFTEKELEEIINKYKLN